MSAIHWLVANWSTVLAVLGAIVVIATVLNSALPYAPRGQGFFEWLKWSVKLIVDLASARAQKGAIGVADTRWTVPFVTVSKPNGVKSDAGPNGTTMLILLGAGLGFVLAMMSGCAWEVAAYHGLNAVAVIGKNAVDILPERCEAAQRAAARAPEIAALPDVNARNDAAHAAVARVVKDCDKAAKGLSIVSDGVKLGLDGVDSARKLKETPKDQRLWLQTALKAWENVEPILRRLGVNVPPIPKFEVP